METHSKSHLSPEVRGQVHELVMAWRDEPELMYGMTLWVGDLASVEVMPKGGRKIFNQLRLAWDAGGFLLQGFEPNRRLKIYQIVRNDKRSGD